MRDKKDEIVSQSDQQDSAIIEDICVCVFKSEFEEIILARWDRQTFPLFL